MASNPNHLMFYEVYDSQAAFKAHASTEDFKHYNAAIEPMVADRNVRPMGVVIFATAAH
jgi:quinol monooxygenase YgiN